MLRPGASHATRRLRRRHALRRPRMANEVVTVAGGAVVPASGTGGAVVEHVDTAHEAQKADWARQPPEMPRDRQRNIYRDLILDGRLQEAVDRGVADSRE